MRQGVIVKAIRVIGMGIVLSAILMMMAAQAFFSEWRPAVEMTNTVALSLAGAFLLFCFGVSFLVIAFIESLVSLIVGQVQGYFLKWKAAGRT
jgi:hypothetical protein